MVSYRLWPPSLSGSRMPMLLQGLLQRRCSLPFGLWWPLVGRAKKLQGEYVPLTTITGLPSHPLRFHSFFCLLFSLLTSLSHSPSLPHTPLFPSNIIRGVYTASHAMPSPLRYGEQLKKARNIGIKKSMFSAGALGALYFIMFNTFALGFW